MSTLWENVFTQELNAIRDTAAPSGKVWTTAQSLAKQYDVSIVTARRVLTELAKKGVVKNVPRRGCVIAKPKIVKKVYLLMPDPTQMMTNKPSSFALIFKGIIEEAMRLNLELTPINFSDLKNLETSQPVALIYFYCGNIVASLIFLELLPLNVITFGVHCPDVPQRGFGVGADAFNIMRKLTKMLIARGNQRIGYCGPITHPHHVARFRGYVSAMREANLKINERYAYDCFSENKESMEEWLKNFRPEAVCASGVEFAAPIDRYLETHPSINITIGAFGLPESCLPGHIYIHTDYYKEGVEVIHLINECDFEQYMADSKNEKMSLKMIGGLFVNSKPQVVK